MANGKPSESDPQFSTWLVGYNQGLEEGRRAGIQTAITWATGEYMADDIEMDSPEGTALRAVMKKLGKFLRNEQ